MKRSAATSEKQYDSCAWYKSRFKKVLQMTEWKVMEQFQDVVSHLKDVVIILESDRVTVSISECHALKLLFKR